MKMSAEQVGQLLAQVCGSEEVLLPEQELLESGLLDSLALIDFFDELNLRGVDIQPTQMTAQDMCTLDGICAFLQSHEA